MTHSVLLLLIKKTERFMASWPGSQSHCQLLNPQRIFSSDSSDNEEGHEMKQQGAIRLPLQDKKE